MSSNKNISPWETHSINKNNQRSQNNNNTDYRNRSSFKPTDTRPFESSQYQFSNNAPVRRDYRVNENKSQKRQTVRSNTTQYPIQTIENHNLWQGAGDSLPSYFGPTMYKDSNGEPTSRPTIGQWCNVQLKRSAQVGIGYGLIHFGESLVKAYLPWEDDNE